MELDILTGEGEYISAARASEKIGYSSDYIGQLCRSKKIPGKLIDRIWYVDLESLLKHKKHSRLGRSRMDGEWSMGGKAGKSSVFKLGETKTALRGVLFKYENDDAPLFPALLKSQKSRNSGGKELFLSLKIATGVCTLLLFLSVGYFGSQRISRPVAFSQPAAISLSGAFDEAVDFIVGGFRDFKKSALDNFLNSSVPSVAVESGVAKVLPSEKEVIKEALAIETSTYTNSVPSGNLKEELEAYLESRLKTIESPVTIYQAGPTFNTTVLREEILTTDTRPTVTRQSDADSGRRASILEAFSIGAALTNPTITGGSFSSGTICLDDECRTTWPTVSGGGITWPFTKLSTDEQATSTTLAFLNGFLSTASSTLTDFTASNSTTTNATSTNLFVSGLASTTILRANILLSNILTTPVAGANLIISTKVASGGGGGSGSINIDPGNGDSSGGVINIGTIFAEALNLGRTAITTTNNGGFLVLGSSTLQTFTAASSTIGILLTNRATTTNLFVSGLASTTNLRSNTGIIGFLTSLFETTTNLLVNSSSTLQDFSFQTATGTTKLYVTGDTVSTDTLVLGNTTGSNFASGLSLRDSNKDWRIAKNSSDDLVFIEQGASPIPGNLTHLSITHSTGLVTVGVGGLQSSTILATGSTTLQTFTAASSTIGTLLTNNATSTNLFVSGLASTSNLRANTAFFDNVGIGTSSPWATLSVAGRVALPNLSNNGSGYYACVNTVGGGGELATSTTACGASSIRFKENVEDLSYGLNDLILMRAVSFDWKQDFMPNGTHQIGFIAEEMKEIIPEIIGYDNQGQVMNLDYPKLTSVIVKAIQEIANITGTFKNKLIAWMGDATNGITEMIAGTFKAKDKLCINNTCVTEAQLQALLQNTINSNSPTPIDQSSNDGITIPVEIGEENNLTSTSTNTTIDSGDNSSYEEIIETVTSEQVTSEIVSELDNSYSESPVTTE